MALSAQTTKVRYVGDGVATHFPIPFPVHNAEHVRVYTTNPQGLSVEVSSGFDILLESSGGASVRFYEPLPLGKGITIARILPYDQTLDLENGGNFNAEEIEKNFDRTVMQIQQLGEGVSRSVKVPISVDETPEELAQELFNARDTASNAATEAQDHADRAELAEQLALAHSLDAVQSAKKACICAETATAAKDVAIGQVETVNKLMEAELAKINTIVDDNKVEQSLAVDQAKRWAEEEVDVPVAISASGGPLYSAKHHAIKAGTNSIPTMSQTVRGVARVGKGLNITIQGELAIAVPVPAFNGTNLKLIVNSQGQMEWVKNKLFDVGEMMFTGFTPWELLQWKPGWYFMNGDYYPNYTPQAVQLNLFPNGFKERWGIINNGSATCIPKFFYEDGRGYFVRAADGTVYVIGLRKDDTMRRFIGHIGASGAGIFYTPSATGICRATDTYHNQAAPADGGGSSNIRIDSGYLGPNFSGLETAPVHVNMTPVIYLAV